jgi:hypothetical protein
MSKCSFLHSPNRTHDCLAWPHALGAYYLGDPENAQDEKYASGGYDGSGNCEAFSLVTDNSHYAENEGERGQHHEEQSSKDLHRIASSASKYHNREKRRRDYAEQSCRDLAVMHF